MKRSLSVALVLFVMLIMGFALAAGGGPGDPLISFTYIRDTFIPSVLNKTEEKLDAELLALEAELTQRMDAISGSINPGYLFSSGYTSLNFSKGGTLTVHELTGFIVTGGSANLHVETGEVVDLNTGLAVKKDCLLASNQRYFATEGTSAVIRFYSDASAGMVDGYYLAAGSGTIPQNLMFIDIPASHWANDSITYLAGRTIIKGVGNDRFAPDDFVTRGTFVTILGRLYGINPEQYTDTRFNDVDMAMWYGPYIAWADEKGIVSGYGNGSFGPNDVITREQMAVVIMKYASFAGISLSPSIQQSAFEDEASISSWALEAVKSAQITGIMTGKPGNLFDPAGTAVRAEVSAVAYRFIEKAGLLF